jgi:peptidoglycan hydrolase-like protein with peptidoglycan-binding domain
MTAEQQLDFVEKYLRPFKGRLRTIEDTYMAVLFPKAIGKDNNFVLFREGTTAFKQNKGLDVDGNGRITKHEAAQKVRERLHVPASPPVPNPEVLATVTTFNPPLSQGDKGPAVKHLQDRLVALGFMTQQQVQTGPGVFGPKTREALRAFQQDHGLEPSGVLTLDTAQVLLNAVPDVTVGHSSTAVETLLPAAGPGFETYLRGANGRHQFGRAATITALRALGKAWSPLHPEIPFQVGHISLKGGGDFPPHKSHRTGNDVDVRPLRTDGLLSPVTIDDAMYSHTLTREFVQLVKQRHPDTTIFFNDRRLVGSMTQAATGHHNHLHLRFRHAS